ncbi:sigma-70 family RNA polymerase sigma factor [Terracoccus sp. 273MFTsu3.1]|uniref:sigma-70 family RNA polymerase sigma factor n=1 Tax=Terracoccus sp. 273MFTsu3.1 TaxID=1172188 RepID=UPI0012DF5211|nr:sigma-70 family RNA polymerase sigma factor [Terracoccus sp. 273MFTsu3.1]
MAGESAAGADEGVRVDGPESDAELVERVRSGDDTAYSVLWSRHEPAARRLASRVASPSDVDDLVSESFTRTLDALRGGGGPDTAFRPYLLSTLRRANIDVARRYTNRVVLTDDEATVDTRTAASAEDEAVDAEERDAVWAAWRSLPDESRSLLWRLVVHEEKPHQIAPGLGTTPNGIASRSKRARERLRQTFLSELVSNAGDADCRAVRRQLGGYVRDSLPVKARERVDAHLDGCARCRAAVLDVFDVDAAIRLRVAPVLLPGAFALASGVGAADAVGAGRVGAGAAGGGADGAGAAGAGGVAATGGATIPVAVGVASLMDGADDLSEFAADVGDGGPGDGSGGVAGRVLSVPGRSAAAVVAAAALVVAAALFLLQLQPTGRVSADAPVGRDSSAGPVDGTESANPAETTRSSAPTSTAPRPVIGVATAEGVSRFRSSGGRTGSADQQTRSPASPAPTSTGTSASATSRPSRSPSPSASATSTPTSTRPTTTPSVVPPPAPVGTVTRLTFTPSDRGYLAHLTAPAGWLVTSVRDVHGARVVEHVSQPTSQFDGRLRAGELVVEVTRVQPRLSGDLVALFTGRSGATLPGSGSYPLR